MSKQKKVFGIGFHKTGTKSLGGALSQLGYKVHGPFGTRDEGIAATALPRALALAERYDAFQDNPWAVLFRELDAAFPGSKFILTICPTQEWLERARRYFGNEETPMRRWIYGAGSPIGNENLYAVRFDSHNRAVIDYFADRPEDLLVFPITAIPRWELLCLFLDEPVPPDKPFPHLNKFSF